MYKLLGLSKHYIKVDILSLSLAKLMSGAQEKDIKEKLRNSIFYAYLSGCMT